MTKFYKTANIIRLLAILSLSYNTGCVFLAAGTAATTSSLILDERSTGNVMDDALIITKIKNEFARTNVSNILAKVSVNVREGRVMLTGTVKESEYLSQAVKLSWGIKGVKEVINEITVAQAPRNKAQDAWISSQIKTKYLLEKHFNSTNYAIDVNDGIVYLLGIAINQEELDTAVYIASSIKGVEKVVSHVLLKNDTRRNI